MKRDVELEKIRGLMARLDEFEHFIYRGDLHEKETRRILEYIASRYKYLFDYINESYES